jgi:hypothetical protein
LLDFTLITDSGEPPTDHAQFQIAMFTQAGDTIASFTAAGQPNTETQKRSRFVADVNAEAESAYISVTLTNTDAAAQVAVELYDAWLEHTTAQNRGTI